MRVVKSPVLALFGLVMLGALALALLKGSVTVAQAGARFLVAVVGLAVADRVVVPVVHAMTSPPEQSPDPETVDGSEQP